MVREEELGSLALEEFSGSSRCCSPFERVQVKKMGEMVGLRRVPAKLLVVSSSPVASSRCQLRFTARVTRVSRWSGSQHVVN